MTEIMIAHNIPYVAQVSPHNWKDTVSKASKGFNADGPSFINAISPCPRGWRFSTDDTISMAKLSVETCVWPLYEVVNGKYTLTAESLRIADGKIDKRPVIDWIKSQGRFKHLLQDKWEPVLKSIQDEVDRRWMRLIKLSEI